MPLPAVKELIVEDDAVYDQYYEACYCQCQSHTHQSSEWGDERPVRPPEESADDDEDHVENHQGQEDRVRRQQLLGELINGASLIIISFFIAVEAYQRLQSPPVINVGLMLIVATGGLLGNLLMA